MKIFSARSLAALCAALFTAAALAGCASSDSKDSSGDSEGKSSGGDKKLEIYVDENDTPYYFDSEGNKMMLWASDYDISLQGDDDEDYSDDYEYITGNYDKNGISFTIPDGWVVDDSYGAPTLLKGTNADDIDYDNNFSILPSQLMFGSETDPDQEINEKFLKNYYKGLVEGEVYSSYKVKSEGEVKIGGEKGNAFSVALTYEGFDDEGNTTEISTTSLIYATTGKNVCLIVFSIDDPDKTDGLKAAYDSMSDSIKLPTAEQVKEMVADFSGELEEGEEGAADFGDDGEEIVVDVPEE